jgi:F0F1-type ATP synthase delta subunit
MEPGSGEFYKIKNWVDTFMRIPFSEYQTLPINITDGVDKCHEFMENAQKTLTDAVYALNDAKKQIIAHVKSMGANEVVLETTIDPATIGGFVLQVGDKQVDATLKTKLNKLKKEFEQKVVA